MCISVSPGAQPFLEQIESSAEALQDYGVSVVKVKGAQGSCWVGWSEQEKSREGISKDFS